MLIYDSARYAENAYFIKQREPGQQNRSIREIVADMFALADGMTMSSKKDGIVNIGGFIGLRDPEIWRQASVFNIMFEGFVTYGGLAGRDMAALAQGLYEACDYDYLDARVSQVGYLGKLLTEYGVPVQRPSEGMPYSLMPTRSFLIFQRNTTVPRRWPLNSISKEASGVLRLAPSWPTVIR
jgi:tryptophanase